MKHSLKSRLLSALLVLVMVLAMFPAPAIAEEAATATLVTDVSALAAGDQVVIVAANNDYALSTNQKSNNRGQTAVTKTGDTVTLNSEVQVLTLEAGTVEGTFAFNTGSGYLYAAGTSKAQNGSKNNNYLRTQTTLDANGSFAVSISAAGVATVTAQGDNGCNLLRHNNQSALFACYASGQNDISLYKVDTAEEEPARESGIVADLTTLQDGDSVVVFNPANLKALSTTYAGFYNAGTDVTLTDGVLAGYTDADVWTLGINDDGSYTFSTSEGKKLSMGASYTSTPLDDVNTAWEISAAATENCFYIKNAVRGNYLEWYAEKNNWSSYYNIGNNEALFAQQIYLIVEDSGETPDPEQPEQPEQPEVPAGNEYTKVETIADGDTVLIYNAGSGTVVSSTKSGYKLAGVGVTPAEDKIVTEDESVAWTVSVVDGKYTFSQGDKVLGAVQSGTYVNPSLNAADGYTTWELVESATDATWYIKNATFPAGNYGPYYLEYYSGYTVYASNNPSDNQFGFVFYRLGGAEPEQPEVPEVPTAEKMTELPGDGDTIIIYNSGNAMGSAASGKKLAAVPAEVTDGKLPIAEEMAQLLVTIDEDGNYIFTLDGKYLTSAPTGNGLSFADELTDCGKWTAEDAVEGAWYLKNVGANYNGNYNQAMEYYSGFTTYGIRETEIYQMELFLVSKAAPEGAGKLTSADQFVSGTYAMVVEGGYAMGALNGNWVTMVQPTIEGDVVTDAKGGIWTLTVDGSSVTITDANGASIKPKGGNANGIASGSYAWAWSFDEATQTFVFSGTGSDTVKLASNASEDATYGGFHRFRAYKNTTIAGNPATYPCNFSLYPIEEQTVESTLPAEGDEVVLYNLDAKGVVALQNETVSLSNAPAQIVDGKVLPENGGVVFTVEKNGAYFRFYNETFGYLCSNGTGNNAYYTQEASDDADWTLLTGKKGGYFLESRTAKFNGQYSQYLEYYADSYKTYSMYNVTNYDIYEFFFYEVGDVNLTGNVVNNPTVVFGDLPDAFVGTDYSFYFTVDAVFGVSELTITVNGNELTAGEDGTYTVPADLIAGESLTIAVSGSDTKGVAISGTATVTVKDEPVIGAVTPAAGSQTGEDNLRPVISAEISNAGEGAAYTMTVGGEAVEAVFENGVLTYVPAADMAQGRTTVTVTVVRADGKEATKTWSFTVGKAQFQLYFGQLHSHTTYSDGSGSLESALTYIKNLPESANVDFVAFTDHSNYFDASGAANPEGALYDMSLATATSQSTWNSYVGTIRDFNASQGEVVAIPGFEMTWSGGPGHINTFNTPGIVSRNNTTLNNKTGDAGMKAYYSLLSQPQGIDSISQFNHPGSTFGTFSDFAYWDAVIDSRIYLVEVGNGEGQVGAGGYYPSYEYYTMALDKGWHVAPTNNQDNHKGKWGNANDARDVVLTDDFTEEGIYAAIRALRMYSTEDKNLEIGYTVNGLQLGSSITEVPEKLDLNVTVFDPDTSDSISKVEVIVNSGKVAHTWSDPADLADGELTVTLDPTYSYYYIRVTEGDGDLAVTAPVWVGESLKLGISSVETSTSTPVTNEELTINTTLFNSETSAATVKTLTYQIKGGAVIGTDTTGYQLPASGNLTVDFAYTPDVAKLTTITVTAVVELDGEEYVFTMDIELDIQDADKLVYIGIDASHYNEYVNGNYKDSMGNFGLLAAEYGVRTVTLYESEDLIAACSNPKYKALILTAPSRRSTEAQAADPLKVYTDEELAAIKAFNEAGGTVILAGWSDHYENYPDVASIVNMQPEEHMAATQNAVLEALGSSLRIGDDATYDDDHNGGQAYRLYFNSYGESFLTEGVEVDPENPHDRMYTEVFSHYGGASVYTVDGTLNTTVTPIVFGHSGTYSVDVDKDGLGGDSMYKYTAPEGDERLMIMATEELEGQGLIIVSGAAFMSNFEVQATIEDSGSEKNYSNYKICENLLKMINPTTITPIAEVQAQTEVGFKYTIEGVVTSNASGYDKDTAFFDCIYVQDATGGICCFPVAGNYKIGDLVRVSGTTEFYQGEMELQVTSIEVIGEGTVEPKEVTAAQVNDLSVIGQLITVKGVVKSFELANGLVQTIMVEDENGDLVRVFIDGYITTDEDVKDLVVGCEITVTGISSYDDTFNAPEGPFPRIRIRDREDVVCGDLVAPPLDLSELIAILEVIAALNPDDYTEESIEALVEAILNAEEVLNGENLTQEDVDAVTQALKDAVDALVPAETEPEVTEPEVTEPETTEPETTEPETTEPETTEPEETKPSTPGDSANTGDKTPLVPLVILMVLSLAALVCLAILFLRRKKK